MIKRFNSGYLIAILTIFVLALAGACASGGSDDSGSYPVLPDVWYGEEGTESSSKYDSAGTEIGNGGSYPGGGDAVTAASASPSRSIVTKGDTVSDNEIANQAFSGSGSASIENEIASASEGRVIIRTADLSITVENVTRSIDDISNITNAAGGWVVTSNQSRNYSGSISIRVPADRFDDVIKQFSDLAVKVKSVSTKSEDFTEEFTDVTARAQTLDDTLERLRVLYDRAFTIEDAITIQKEITDVQSDLEALEARLNFLSQSSAFSFISVDLDSVAVELIIDGGDDVSAAVGHPVTYRATFTPPADMEEFYVTWNFGDGSLEESTDRMAPTGNGNEMISSPVIHYFDRDEDSPFIVIVKLHGSGDAGLVEGKDTLVTTVSRLPVIEVFAGEDQIVESGSKVEFSASFTRPEGVSEILYSWNFGDGSAPDEGMLGAIDDSSKVDAIHTYQNFRPNPYVGVLTITGQTEVGEVEATGKFLVFVRETIGVAAADLNAGNTVRDASRTLQSFGVFLAKAGLWLLILSPVWLIGGVVLFVLLRRRGAISIPRRGS